MYDPKQKKILIAISIIMILTVFIYVIASGSAKDFIDMCKDLYYSQLIE